MKIIEIKTELDYQRGKIISRKLRKAPGSEYERKELMQNLYEYEQKHWANFDAVTDEQVIESDEAEAQAERELLT